MAVLEGAASAALADVGAAAQSGLHVINKPTASGALGHYRVAALTGSIGAGMASNGELVQFRWTDASKLAVIHSVRCNGIYATTAFAAGAITVFATIARSFTAAGTGGGALTLTGNNNKARTSMATTSVGEVRVSTTAALGAGTKVLDGHNVGQIITHSSAGWNSATPIIGSIYLPRTDLVVPDTSIGEHPIVLAQNEGLVIRATVPGTGVWIAGFEISWAEVTAY